MTLNPIRATKHWYEKGDVMPRETSDTPMKDPIGVDFLPEEQANLGIATTRELLAEIAARFEIQCDGGLDYRTVDDDDDRIW